MTDATRNDDRELTQYAIGELRCTPEEMRQAEINMANIQLDIRQAKAELADAELDAQVNCNADAKNAEGRKLQLDKAVKENSAVQMLRTKLAGLEAILVGAETSYNDLHRRYRAALVITELQTAKIIYLAKFEPMKGRQS